jgi:methylamine--corrinoid protein Co-methyltransferase
LEVLDKAHTGPVCKVKDWEARIVPLEIKRILKEHGLTGVCAPENPVNTDDGLVDDFWEAGFELALSTGMLCLATERIIKFTEEELKEALRNRPSRLTLGSGSDRVVIEPRKPEDKKPPITTMTPLGITFSEDLIIPVCQAIAQYRVVDIVISPCLLTFHGRICRGGTPYETLWGKYEGLLVREATRRAGRPGMPAWGVESSPTEYGYLGGYGAPGSFDPSWAIAIALLPSPLKTDYSLLHKVAHAINWGAPIESGHWTMIGGYEGPPEGAAVGALAAHVLQCAVMQPTVIQSDILDVRYFGNCGREAIWANSITVQARSMKTNTLPFGVTSQVSGPCTDMLLYETACISVAEVSSGICMVMGTRPTGCRFPDYASGLENRFCAEVVKASAGLRRGEACELVKALLPRYEDRLRRPPKGLSFPQCTDLKTLQPTPEWQAIYEKVWKELENLGLQKPWK